MKVLTEPRFEIHVSEMKDGDIAVIVSWKHVNNKDTIVQRCGDDLISLGKGLSSKWAGVFAFGESRLTKGASPHCQVRVLPPGTTIEV